MPKTPVVDRQATHEEVVGQRDVILQLARDLGLARVRTRSDGTLVVHSPESGYHTVLRLSAAASQAVGRYVHVITDDVPGAADSREL